MEMIIHYQNKLLGMIINTRTMRAAVPPEHIKNQVTYLKNHWFKPEQKMFYTKEAEQLAGQLGHIADSAP